VTDILYWLLFIGHNGVDEYFRVHHNVGKQVVEAKLDLVNKVRRIGHKEFRRLTSCGPSYTQGRVCELLTKLQNPGERSSVDMFPMYCVLYECSIFLVDSVKRTYVLFDYSAEDKPNAWESHTWESRPIIVYVRGNRFTVECDALTRIRSGAFDNLVRIRSHNDPLEAIGKYTKAELINMHSKLCTTSQSIAMNKQELYDAIRLRIYPTP
jgi:hypothetical protein